MNLKEICKVLFCIKFRRSVVKFLSIVIIATFGVSLTYNYTIAQAKIKKSSNLKNHKPHSSLNNKDKVSHSTIMKLMFPNKVFTERNGIFIEKVPYQLNFQIESIQKGSFVYKNNKEYLVVVKETGEPHAGGLENRFTAIFNNTMTKLLSSVKEFNADSGQILTFKGKEITYIYFEGTRTYQGYTYSSDVIGIGLWKAGKEWKRLWPKDNDYWKDRIPMAKKDVINVYSIKGLANNTNENNINSWKLESTFKWNPGKETFIEIKPLNNKF